MHPPPGSFVPTPRAARFDLLVRGAPVPSPCVPRDASWHPARRHSGRSAASDVTLAQRRSRRNPALLLRDPISTSKGPAVHLGEAPKEGAREGVRPSRPISSNAVSGSVYESAFICGQCFLEVVSWTKHSGSNGQASFLLFVRTVLPSEAPEAPSGRGSRGWRSNFPKYLLQSLPSLYTMIVRRLVWLTAPPQRIGQRLAA
jgi:hypothetical protein